MGFFCMLAWGFDCVSCFDAESHMSVLTQPRHFINASLPTRSRACAESHVVDGHDLKSVYCGPETGLLYILMWSIVKLRNRSLIYLLTPPRRRDVLAVKYVYLLARNYIPASYYLYLVDSLKLVIFNISK